MFKYYLYAIWPSAKPKSKKLQFIDKGKMYDKTALMKYCSAAEFVCYRPQQMSHHHDFNSFPLGKIMIVMQNDFHNHNICQNKTFFYHIVQP